MNSCKAMVISVLYIWFLNKHYLPNCIKGHFPHSLSFDKDVSNKIRYEHLLTEVTNMWQSPFNIRFLRSPYQNSGQTFKTIDEYIAAQAIELQPTLLKIRKTIRKIIPNAIEKISYMMPTFWDKKNIVHFAAFKNHISLFPGSEATTYFAERLKDYKTSKGTIQFPLNKPIDHQLIEDIVKWRSAQVKK